MRQTGKMTLVNNTNSDWKKTSQHSLKMHVWDFPESIKAGKAIIVDIEWDQDIIENSSSYTEETTYTLIESGESFKLQARIKEEIELVAYLHGIETMSNPKGSIVSLGQNQNRHVNFILSGTKGNYSPIKQNGSTWMHDNISLLGNQPLSNLCITGSHDSGMSTLTSTPFLASDCNTLTQTNDIKQQLNLGTRYFDIRPVLKDGKYYTGHFSQSGGAWFGGTGQSIDDVISNVNDFTSYPREELIILNLSHSEAKSGIDSFKTFGDTEWKNLIKKLATKLDNLFIGSEDTCLTTVTLKEFTAEGSAVVVICEQGGGDIGKYEWQGIFRGQSFDCDSSEVRASDGCQFEVVNCYSSTSEKDTMIADQLSKLEKYCDKYFLLSWTLTQSHFQQGACKLHDKYSIRNLADGVNADLIAKVYPKVEGPIFPNIIYTDNVISTDSADLAMAINKKRIENTNTISLCDTSNMGPALAVMDNSIYLAWKGTAHPNLNIMSINDRTKTTLNEASNESPALAVMGTTIYMAWKGLSGEGLLNISNSTDKGITWNSMPHISLNGDNQISNVAPALAVMDDTIFSAWIGTSGLNLINVLRSEENVSSWTGKQHVVQDGVNQSSALSPALAVMGDALFIAWIGTSGDNLINVCYTTDKGTTWSDKQHVLQDNIKQTSDVSPALTVIGDTLYIAWKGMGGGNLLNVMCSTDKGSTWTNKTHPNNDTTIAAPALTGINGKYYLAWKGDQNDYLNIYQEQ